MIHIKRDSGVAAPIWAFERLIPQEPLPQRRPIVGTSSCLTLGTKRLASALTMALMSSTALADPTYVEFGGSARGTVVSNGTSLGAFSINTSAVGFENQLIFGDYTRSILGLNSLLNPHLASGQPGTITISYSQTTAPSAQAPFVQSFFFPISPSAASELIADPNDPNPNSAIRTPIPAPVLYTFGGSTQSGSASSLTYSSPAAGTVKYVGGASAPDPFGQGVDNLTISATGTAGISAPDTFADTFVIRVGVTAANPSGYALITGRTVSYGLQSLQSIGQGFTFDPDGLNPTNPINTPASGSVLTVPVVLTDASGSGSVILSDHLGLSGTIVFTQDQLYTGGTTINSGLALQLGNGGTTGSVLGSITDNGALVFDRSSDLVYAGVVSGPGSMTQAGTGTVTLTADQAYAGGTTINSGATLQLGNGGASGSVVGGIVDNGALVFDRSANLVYPGVVSGAGSLTQIGSGTLTFSGFNTYTGGTTINAGTLALFGAGTLGATSGPLNLTGGTLDLGGTSQTTGALTLAGGTILNGNLASSVYGLQSGTISAALAGSGAVTKTTTGTVTLSGANTYTGGTTINAGTLALSGAGTLGATTNTIAVNAGGTLDLGGTTQTSGALTLAGGTVQNGTLASSVYGLQSGTISANLAGTGAVTKTTTGAVTLSGANTYTGGTTIDAGTLNVTGALATSGTTTINSGGTLTGTGTVGPLMVSDGGIFAPGSGTARTSMTVARSLAFTPSAAYVVNVAPTSASHVVVKGAATLGGAGVTANFEGGSYFSKTYTILAARSVSGQFGALNNVALPSGFTDSFAYGSHKVSLVLTDSAITGSGSPTNQSSVNGALANYFDTNNRIPAIYTALPPAVYRQASGLTGTGSAAPTFHAMNAFGNVLSGGSAENASNPTGGGSPSSADSGNSLWIDDASAVDADLPKTELPRQWSAIRDPHWAVWAQAYGASGTTAGSARTGAATTQAQVSGLAVGADTYLSPTTVLGYGVGGGGTNDSLANGLGSGHSDLFETGATLKQIVGTAYFSGLFSYTWQDITTTRPVSIGTPSVLQGKFNANSLQERLEAGNRFDNLYVGITPFARAQLTSLFLPGYGETVVRGANAFALNYASKTIDDPRTELGVKFDKTFALADGGNVTFKSSAAFAHDYNVSNSVNATFQELPGASFTTTGAQPAPNSAVTSLGAEFSWTNGWSVDATAEGEFSSATTDFEGNAVVKYTW